MICDLSEQYRTLLVEAGFIATHPTAWETLNEYSRSWEVVKAVLCAGMYPNLVRVDYGRGKRSRRCKLFTKGHGKIKPHPSSVNGNENDFNHHWLMYHDKVREHSFRFVFIPAT